METKQYVSSHDGVKVAVWRSGRGPALVLVHGTAADHTRWAHVASAFSRDFTVYALDRRGRGDSGDSHDYSLDREAADIAAVVEMVAEPVILLGHSYGAICCLEAALHLQTLHRLILYEPPVFAEPATPKALLDTLDELIARNERDAAILTFFRDVVGVPDQQLEMMRRSPSWAARCRAAHTVPRELWWQSKAHATLDRYRAIAAPTLLLFGGASPAFFQRATQFLNTLIPNSQVHELVDQQHIAMDTNPAEFVRVVTAFGHSESAE